MTMSILKRGNEGERMPSRKTSAHMRARGKVSGRMRGNILGILAAMLLVGACLIPQPVQGAGRDPSPRELFDRGEFGKAYQVYHRLFLSDPGNPEINFNLGRAAFEAGDFEAAVMAFERVLMARPDAVRVKLEIGRCYFHLGSLETAKGYFEEVMAADPPRQVRTNIEKYLDAIRSSGKEHFFSARVSLGIDFDDNVNTAPSSSNIEITDLLGNVFPVTVDDAQGDQITTGTAHLNYLYKPLDGSLCWKFSALNYNALYRDAENLDLSLFDVKAGFCIEHGNMAWDVYGLANHLNLDYDQYLRTYGGGTSLSFVLSPRILLSTDARYRRKNYDELDDRDAHNLSFTLSPAFALDIGRISFSAGWEREIAEEDVNAYTRINGIAGYQVDLPFAFGVYASYWYQGTDYDEIYPLFGKKRSDDVQYLSAGLSRTFALAAPRGAAIILNIGYTHTRSDSNIDLYTYTKNVTSMSVTFAF